MVYIHPLVFLIYSIKRSNMIFLEINKHIIFTFTSKIQFLTCNQMSSVPISESIKCRYEGLELGSQQAKRLSDFSQHSVFAFLLCLKWSVLSSKQHLEIQDLGLMPS